MFSYITHKEENSITKAHAFPTDTLNHDNVKLYALFLDMQNMSNIVEIYIHLNCIMTYLDLQIGSCSLIKRDAEKLLQYFTIPTTEINDLMEEYAR